MLAVLTTTVTAARRRCPLRRGRHHLPRARHPLAGTAPRCLVHSFAILCLNHVLHRPLGDDPQTAGRSVDAILPRPYRQAVPQTTAPSTADSDQSGARSGRPPLTPASQAIGTGGTRQKPVAPRRLPTGPLPLIADPIALAGRPPLARSAPAQVHMPDLSRDEQASQDEGTWTERAQRAEYLPNTRRN
jgi:hypothetical protein